MGAGREELIRREFDRWNAGEREIDPQVVHHDVVVHSQMTNATYHGYEGVRRYFAEIDDQFEAWHVSIDEFRDAPEERLLALGAIHFRGRTSGVESDQPVAWLLTFAGDQVTELRTIHDHAQALEAAGLRNRHFRQSGSGLPASGPVGSNTRADGHTDAKGRPSPLVGALVAGRYRGEIRVRQPPDFVQRLLLPPLAALARRRGLERTLSLPRPRDAPRS